MEDSGMEELDNFMWPEGTKMLVFGINHSQLTHEEVQNKLYQKGAGAESFVAKPARTRILRLTTLRKTFGGDPAELKDFVAILAKDEVANVRLFGTKLVKVIIDYFKDEYFEQV